MPPIPGSLSRFLVGASVATIASFSTSPRPASACRTLPPSTRPMFGMLGVASGLAPRNAVFLDANALPSRLGVTLVADEEFPWFHPEPLLQAETELEGGTVRITDAIDTAPPIAPELLTADFHPAITDGCGNPAKCGGDRFEITFVAPVDDVADPDDLAYFVAAGDTADEAALHPTVRVLLVPTVSGHLTIYGDEFTPRRTRFVTIAAVDQAGNVSESSAAVRVR